MFRLKRLKIDRYRNVAPGTELTFNDTFNVFLGQNGTGKTTLLNLISMVIRGDFSDLKDENFNLAYELYAASIPAEISVRISRSALNEAPTQGSAAWSSDVILRLDGHDREVAAHASPLTAIVTDTKRPGEDRQIPVVAPTEERFLLRAMLELLHPVPEMDKAAILSAGLNGNCARFDESLGAFDAMTGNAGRRAGGGLRATTLELIRKMDSSGYQFWSGFMPSSLTRALLVRPPSTWEAEIRIPGDELPFLMEAVTLMKFRTAELRLSRLKREVREQAEHLLYGDFKFHFTDEDGSQISHDFLSYGQKRVLAFLYYLAANDQTVIADELVNGMHHEWIEACRDAIGNRQSFLTSQNPLLLDYLPFETAEEARRTFVLCSCTMKQEQEQKQLRWENMSEADAVDFFRAYEVGIQHVSAILRTKGLW